MVQDATPTLHGAQDPQYAQRFCTRHQLKSWQKRSSTLQRFFVKPVASTPNGVCDETGHSTLETCPPKTLLSVPDAP